MKQSLVNLLIVFALSLCVLMSIQWVREAHLHQNLQAVTDTLHDRDEVIRSLQGQIKRSEAEVQRLEGIRSDLTATMKSNQVAMATLGKSLEKAENEVTRQTHAIESYKEALQKANENITRQNEDILKQNAEIKKVAEERNDVVLKFNKMAADFNDLAKKWNEMQEKAAKEAAAKSDDKK